VLIAFGDSLSANAGAWPSLVGDVAVVAEVGAKIPDLAAQLDAAPPGNGAVVTIGTNDALSGAPIPAECLREYVALMRSRYGRVAVVRAVLFRPWHPRKEWVRWLGERRDEAVAALGSVGAEVITPRLGPLCWSRDGIHPNARGQRRIARAVSRWSRRAS